MSEPSVKFYSLAEVANHNSNQSVWVIIHNNVYDLTSFLYEHPGGEEVLLEQAGRDATDCFENIGHSTEARDIMKRYKIGEVIQSERKEPSEKTPQYGSTDQQTSTNVGSTYKHWIIPMVLGILITIIYGYLFW